MVHYPQIYKDCDPHGETWVPCRVLERIASSEFSNEERVLLLYALAGSFYYRKTENKTEAHFPPVDECYCGEGAFAQAFDQINRKGVLRINPYASGNDSGWCIRLDDVPDYISQAITGEKEV